MRELAVIVPCYNEEEVLPLTVERLRALLARMIKAGRVSERSYILFVDDGSRDATWCMIEQFAGLHVNVRGMKLARNRGHQFAVLAGMLEAEGELLVTIDADLQDDENAIDLMVQAVEKQSAEIVYGVRSKRDTDTGFKRITAEGFYRLLDALGVDIVFNHADFRLLTRRAVEAFRAFEERNLFLRGMIPMLGFRTAVVEYARTERLAGESKYPVWKMLSLAWEGVTSLSIRPLRLITAMGLAVAGLAFLGGMVAITQWMLGATISGWASLMVAVVFLGGMQLLAIGMIGEYVGKVYLEVKRRPRYLVETLTEPLNKGDTRADP